MRLLTLLLLLAVQFSSQKSPNIAYDLSSIAESAAPWDIDGPCQVYVERLSVAIGSIVQCAANYTIPPKVCTNCIDEYIKYRHVEYDTKHLDKVWSLDNSTCSDVIYRNYLLSYVNELSQAVDTRIWDISRCADCISIEWNFENQTSSFHYSDNVITFKDKLELWRACISNYSDVGSLVDQNNTAICVNCNDLFTDLYKFYWTIYVTPNVQFCVDVETTMNDTVRLWNNVWNCSTTQDRKREFVPVTITAGLLVLFTVFFYLSSYIQGGGEVRRFVQYSTLADPRPARQHLLSTSASETNMSSRASRSSGSTNPLSARRPRANGQRD
ncbi:hypothetical protein PENTCL1PPCAC_6075 [Pristionchus entomophagus]|uniref:Osteopetrosis-associated transmembrane protein 1 n=1 Tax=Pristionchus entomophagus TaxID=358040 RepID=A0AAV5SLR2_9BILA|nr:hypothetical protein PENTCL1PPCAC_6075 [Pristionchus entomophagus]